MCVKRALASSAALAASRGRMNTLGTDSIAAMDRISLEHLRAAQAAGAPESAPCGCHIKGGPGPRCQSTSGSGSGGGLVTELHIRFWDAWFQETKAPAIGDASNASWAVPG